MKTTAMAWLLVLLAAVACKGNATAPVEGTTAVDSNPSVVPDSEGMVIPPGQEALLLTMFSPEGVLPAGWEFDGADVEKAVATITYTVESKHVALQLRRPDAVIGGTPLYKSEAFLLVAAEGNPAGPDLGVVIDKLRPGLDKGSKEWKWMLPKSLARKLEPPSGAAGAGQAGPGQPVAGQPMPGQPMQGQPMQGQPMQGQPMQGQPMPGQPTPGQPMPGQPMQGQPMQAQPQAPVTAQPMQAQPTQGQVQTMPAQGQAVAGQVQTPAQGCQDVGAQAPAQAPAQGCQAPAQGQPCTCPGGCDQAAPQGAGQPVAAPAPAK